MSIKNITAVLICIVLFVCTSCTQTLKEEPEIPDFTQLSADGPADLNFSSIVLAQCADYKLDPFGYLPDSTMYDMFMNRLGELGDRHNCTLSIAYDPDILSSVRNAIWSATDVGYDLIYMGNSSINFTAAANGLLHPLTDSDIIDVTDYGKYGTPNLQENCMFDGIVYGVVPAALPMIGANGVGAPMTLINESYIKKYAMEDPRDLYENDLWTVDYFKAHLRDYYVNEGDSEIYSMLVNYDYWGYGFVGAYGIRLVSDYEGKTYSCFEHPLIVEALTELVSCREENRDNMNITTDFFYWDHFINGGDVMCMGSVGFISRICTEVEDFGLVLFPTSKYISKGEQYTFYSCTATLSIPYCSDEPDTMSMLISELLEPYEGMDRKSYENFLLSTTFFDMRDVQVFLDYPLREVYNYYAVGGVNPLKSILAIDSTQSIKQTVDSNSSVFAPIMEKYIIGNYEKTVGPYLRSTGK